MAVATYTKSGTKATTPAKLDKKVFGLEVKNHDLLKQAYLTYLANGRTNLAKTKKRGEVSGGGIKPWRQKGTGRARFGSSRNPIWTGGGVAFGPSGNENYSKRLSTTAKRLAIAQALTLAATEDRIKVIEDFNFKEGKVKPTLALLKKIGAEGRLLVVVAHKDGLTERATGNIPNIKVVQATYLNVFDVMNADQIIISREGLQTIHDWLGAKNV
ncbi:MAG TPA: 50S ribosomal protein L4 [Candidatus Binatia bacterium]|nr:50S ribosomal protein L4 [Candidatus Binatia bacterium]